LRSGQQVVEFPSGPDQKGVSVSGWKAEVKRFAARCHDPATDAPTTTSLALEADSEVHRQAGSPAAEVSERAEQFDHLVLAQVHRETFDGEGGWLSGAEAGFDEILGQGGSVASIAT
jgi:hypothetical protein